MRRLGELALALLMGTVPLPVAWAGAPAAPTFQSFDLTAVGTISGAGAFAMQNASLTTFFQVPTGGPIDLQLSFFGPGAPVGMTVFGNVGSDPDICDGIGTALCQLTMPVTFGPSTGILPGVQFGATGQLVNGSIVTAQSTFLAVAAPEPTTFALLGAGLLGAVVMRRRARA